MTPQPQTRGGHQRPSDSPESKPPRSGDSIFNTAAALARTGLRSTQSPSGEPVARRQRSTAEVPAPLARRAAATLVDMVIVGALVASPFWMALDGDDSWWPPLMLVLGVAMLVVVTVLRARTGRSVISALVGVRTVAGQDGHAPGLPAMMRRHIVFCLSMPIFGAPLWSTALTGGPMHRGWHDKAAGTRVLDTRWGRDPLEDATAPASPSADRELPDLGRGKHDTTAVLPSGIDVTPDPLSDTTEDTSTGRDDSQWVAIVDAAERAGGATTGQTAVVVVEDTPKRVWATLVDETGAAVSVVSSVLLGRTPRADPGENIDDLMELPDSTHTVSRTHARVDVSDSGVTITDRNSSNGSAVRIGGVTHPLEPGVPMGIPLGAELLLGDHVVRVEGP